MLACVDVAYRDHAAIAGCVLFRAWSDQFAADQVVTFEPPASPYRSGEFYLRELPPILAVLKRVKVQIETIIVDGYVWLNGDRMGLGAHLHSALGEKVPIVGVAKNPWRGGTSSQYPERRIIPVIRGSSTRPLYVTSVMMDVALAARLVESMHGSFRIPTLLAEVNRIVQSAH
ncbi:MAG TPA: endonuclease V [Candidatus Angelobacter sp.]